MPIYAYSCGACGHAKDVLQKMSDPSLTTCPACGADAFRKQVTAAGFQLKGSGWYVTDFRGGSTSGPVNKTDGDSPASPATDAESADAGAGASPAAAAAPASSAGASTSTATTPTPTNTPKAV